MKQTITIDHEPARAPDLDVRPICRRTLAVLAKCLVGAPIAENRSVGIIDPTMLWARERFVVQHEKSFTYSRMLTRWSGSLPRLQATPLT